MGGNGSGAWQRTAAAREQARRRRIERGATDIDEMARSYNISHPDSHIDDQRCGMLLRMLFARKRNHLLG
jgi:protein subunit release factor A